MIGKKNHYDESEWVELLITLEKAWGKKPNLEVLLYLIGIQELGKGLLPFSKEQKQDLMHIAICKLLSQAGYYVLSGIDNDGWPHWENIKPLPFISLKDQEGFLKLLIVDYFKSNLLIDEIDYLQR